MKTIDLTKKLIEIPSFVSGSINESMKSEFIYDLLKKNKGLIVEKQKVDSKRFNVIAKDKYPTKLLLAGHIDTVEPKPESKYDPLKPIISGRKLYGLGSVDMLGGVASILSLMLNTETKGVAALFYVDEEYNFSGMKKFISESKMLSKTLELCAITEPTNLKICNAHRGLIEVEYVVGGKTAHASRPNEGINAISKSVEAVDKLTKRLSKYKSALAGITSCNLSKIEGGLNVGSKNNNLVLSEGSNSVADVCKVKLDIRPASIRLKANTITKIFKSELRKSGCELLYAQTNFDLGCLSVPKNKMVKVIRAITKSSIKKVEFVNSNDMGYGDGQMIFENLDIPVVYFGAGPSQMCHKPDEYVNIDDLIKLDKFLNQLTQLYK